MLAIYLVAAILGGGLVVFSAIGGIHGHGDADAGGDHGHDADAAGAFWLPFFSVRFYVYALAAFGILGASLTLTGTSAEPTRLVASSLTGLAVGVVASTLVRWLTRSDRSSAATHADFLGAFGRVTVPVRPGSPGKVRTSVKGDIIDLIALPELDEELEAGEEVVVLDMEDTVARVGRANRVLDEIRQSNEHAN